MKFRKFSLAIVLSLIYFLSACNQAEISRQWPQFRGYMGKGILDQTDIPITWNLPTAENVLWKTPIPRLAHSGPVIWDNFVFVTSAVSSANLDSLKIGLYGDIDMADDRSIHQFKVYCLNKKTGKIIWDRIADEGVPKERRHTKSTYANPTPAITDGMIIFRTQHSMIAIGKK